MSLDEIRQRAEAKPAYSWPHEAQVDRDRLLAAVDAVLALAESAPRFQTHDGGNASGILQADKVIAAVTDALGGEA